LIIKREILVPENFKDHFQNNPKAWKNYSNLPPSHQKAYTSWIYSAKREETILKRIAEMIRNLEKGLKLGMK